MSGSAKPPACCSVCSPCGTSWERAELCPGPAPLPGLHFAQVVQDLALSRFSMLSARDRGLWSCQLAACVHSNIFFIPLYNRLGYDKF